MDRRRVGGEGAEEWIGVGVGRESWRVDRRGGGGEGAEEWIGVWVGARELESG